MSFHHPGRLEHVTKLLERVTALGGDGAALARDVGLDPAALAAGRAEVDAAQLAALYEAAARATGDEAFGLHFFENAHWQLFDAVGFAALSMPTLGAAFEAVAPAVRALHGLVLALSREGERACISFRLRGVGQAPCRHRAEGYMVVLVQFARLVAGGGAAVDRVGFTHPAPRDGAREHERIFRAPVAFGQPENAATFAASLLDRHLTRADLDLSALLGQHVRSLVAAAPARRLADEVSAALRRNLIRGRTSLADMARELSMTSRSVQRQLRREGTSHRQVLDQVRHEYALGALRERRRTVADVAFSLGYANEGAFARAFARWEASTPAAFRRRGGG